jgi:hypothetical protein
MHERVRDSHVQRDPDIETGSIDAQGNLTPSQSTLPIPPTMWLVAPRVLLDKPDLGEGTIVLFVWADQERSRRAYIIDVLEDVAPTSETATINGDGTLTTARGTVVDAANWARTQSTSLTVDGAGVVIVWADSSALRKAYAVAEL